MPHRRCPRRSPAARALAFSTWTGLGLLLGGWTTGEPDLCVVSRHSGEVLAGDDFSLNGSSEGRRAEQLAQFVRIEAEAGRGGHRTGTDFDLVTDPDRVVVVRLGDPTRQASLVGIPTSTRGEGPVEVQVFGLVGPDAVSVFCRGRAARVRSGEVEGLPGGWQSLPSALGTGSILCTDGPWQVRVAGRAPRPYAGVFSFRPLPERTPEAGISPREARARRGSEVVFRTTLRAYVSGVLAAEQARLDGEAAVALAEVIAHDAHVERHRGRPLCDTTHCQAFLGTAPTTPDVREALSLPALPTNRWLPYFRGGDEPWEVRRPASEVRSVLGEALRFSGDGRNLEVVRSSGVERIPCEQVRAALRLPGCPTGGTFEGETVRIRGRGRGHGLGLDVEGARASGLSAAEILRRAYGLP